MTALGLLLDLRRRGVILGLKGERLTVRAPKGVLTPELRALLTARKADLLAVVPDPPEGPREGGPSSARAPVLKEAWFVAGAFAPPRQLFAYDSKTRTYPGWWDYLYELHNRGRVVVRGRIVRQSPENPPERSA